MTNSAARDELIFITNIIKSGSAFGKCRSDGTGVFIPALIFSKYGKGCDIGDCVMARMVTNANDVRGELPMLAVTLTAPVDTFDNGAIQVALSDPDDPMEKVADILNDTAYDDRMFSADDMLIELGLPMTAKNIKSVTARLNLLCDQGFCNQISARNGGASRVWYTCEAFRPE